MRAHRLAPKKQTNKRKNSAPAYDSSVEDFDIVARHYSEETCTTATTNEIIEFGDILTYLNNTVLNTADAIASVESGETIQLLCY